MIPLLKFKEEQALLRTGSVMEPKNPLLLVSENWEKVILSECISSIIMAYIYFMQDQTHKVTKFAYNENRALMEQGFHLVICNHNSSHCIRFPGGLNPWKISSRMFSLANVQTSFPSQEIFKNSEH